MYSQLAVSGQMINKYKTIDTSIYRITYSFEFKNDPKMENYFKDIRTLEVGKDITKDYSKLLFDNDSIATVNVSKGINAIPNKDKTFPAEIFYYRNDSKSIVTYRTFLTGQVLRYEEYLPEFKWKIEDMTDTILGYSVQKASCFFRGRNYIAWFSSEIPFKTGPYKFRGLPGLILKIEDSDKNFVWNVLGIKKTNQPIKDYEWKYTNTTREKANATIQRMYSDPISFITSLGGKVNLKQKDGSYKRTTSSDKQVPYNPIEKE